MPKSFAITSDVTEPIQLEGGGSKTVIFTVTNTTNRPLRGIARVKALGNTKHEWLSFSEPKEKDFPPNGTQQYTVSFNPKADSASTAAMGKQPRSTLPAGEYKLQLNVSSAINPDEDSTDGPVMTIMVREIPRPMPRPFPWWIIPVAAVLLIGIGLTVYFLWPKSTTMVEDVVGREFSDAQTRLQRRGFVVVRENVQVPTKRVDEVHEQTPPPNTEAALGSTVTLKVAEVVTPTPTPTPTVAVEDVVGREFSDAQTRLQELGFVVVRKDVEIPTKKPNEVDTQLPEPKTEAPLGSTVTLRVVEPAPVPNLQGKDIKEAFDLLQHEGLVLGGYTGSPITSTRSLATVTSQFPGAYSFVAKGSKVNATFPCGQPGLEPCLYFDLDPERIDKEGNPHIRVIEEILEQRDNER
jgi:beta-lactam-binding protein with PASTA domain